jgi:excisionase family DNA binding protein
VTLLPLESVAKRLSVKMSKVRTMIFKGEIPYYKIGRLVRISEEYLNEFILKGTVPAINKKEK